MDAFSKNEQTLILEMIYDCVKCDSIDGFKKIIDRLSDMIQSSNVVFLSSRGNYYMSPALIKELNISYPKEWTEIYRARNFAKVDPVISKGLSGLLYWQDVYKMFPVDKEFCSQAKSFGLINGFSHIQANKNHFGLLSIAEKTINNTPRNQKIINYLAPHFHCLVDKLTHRKTAVQKVKLTDREREILLWITEGKTNWETSVILNIGAESVKTHMANILDKLGACNRTHAASIALQNNLLFP